MPTETRLHPIGPKKLLAMDGGGIRGVLSLEVLKRIEDTLRAKSTQPATFRLSDYFDYIAGTSTEWPVGKIRAYPVIAKRSSGLLGLRRRLSDRRLDVRPQSIATTSNCRRL